MRRLRHRLGRWLLRDWDETDLTAGDLQRRLDEGTPVVLHPTWTTSTSTIPCRCDNDGEVCWLHDIKAWNRHLESA